MGSLAGQWREHRNRSAGAQAGPLKELLLLAGAAWQHTANQQSSGAGCLRLAASGLDEVGAGFKSLDVPAGGLCIAVLQVVPTQGGVRGAGAEDGNGIVFAQRGSNSNVSRQAGHHMPWQAGI